MIYSMKSPLALAGLLLSNFLPVDAAYYPQNGTSPKGTYTPAAMLSAPRRSPGSPNEAGTLALYSSNTYNFTTASRKYGTYILSLLNGSTTQYTNSSALSDFNWLGSDNKILYLQGEEDGSTSIVVGDALKPSAAVIAGSLPASISNLKVTSLANGTYGIAFTGLAAPNGTLYNSALAEEPVSTGLVYTTLFVRHWDTYITPQRQSIWYASLSTTFNGTYKISEPVNALDGTGLESPIPPFGATDHFDISPYGLVYVAKDPILNQARTTKSDVYYVPLKTFHEKSVSAQIVTTENLEGASTGVIFSPVGPSLLFARQKDVSYESDKWRIIDVPDVTVSLAGDEFYKTANGLGAWDRSAAALFWSADGKTIYVEAEDFARVRLFSLPANSSIVELPSLIHAEGSVTGVSPLKDGRVFVTSASFIENSLYEWVDPIVAAASNATQGITPVSANLKNGALWGLSKSQISEFWYKGGGDGDYNVQAWIIKPSFFQPNHTYPLAFYIHGGPQGATGDTWSTRWNLALFAEQGYVVVAFNPTGSTGFGQWLTDHIQNQWGGHPYQDLLKGYEYIEKNLPYVDLDRAVALGASYGGYMVNWIQGQDFGRKFKALFTHDGAFDTTGKYATEELWFMEHEFNGTLWDAYDNYARWNPALYTGNWSTPHLIVHNELDYRLPIADGLQAFNVLQSRGVESKLLIFPDENHWVLKPQNSIVWHKAVLDWLNTRVGLAPYSEEDDVEYRSLLQNGPWIS